MRFFWLLASAALVAVPALAHPANDALTEVAKCADIAAAADRLACYDKAATAAKMTAAPAAAQPAAAESEPEDEGGVMRWFGLADRKPITKNEDFGKPPVVMDGPKEITEISSTVVELAQNALGRSIFVLDNGQVWKQIDGDTTVLKPPSQSETMKVTIEKAFMGSYSLKVEGRTGLIKVRRVK